MPAYAGIQGVPRLWIPAYAGMTFPPCIHQVPMPIAEGAISGIIMEMRGFDTRGDELSGRFVVNKPRLDALYGQGR